MRIISEMVQDRNKLPIYQLILMPSSNSSNWSFYNFVNSTFPKCLLELGEDPTYTEKMVTHQLLF